MAEAKILSGKECPVHIAKQRLNDDQFVQIFGKTKEEVPNCDFEDRNSEEYKNAEIDNRTNQTFQDRQRQSFPDVTTVAHSTGDNMLGTCYNHSGLFRDSQVKMEIIHDHLRPFLRKGEPIELLYRSNKRSNIINDKKNKVWENMVKTRNRYRFRNRDGEDNVRGTDEDRTFGYDELRPTHQQYKDTDAMPDPELSIGNLDNPYE